MADRQAQAAAAVLACRRIVDLHEFPEQLALLLASSHGGASAISVSSKTPPASDGSVLPIANKGAQTLGIVDPMAGKQVAIVEEGGTTGHEVVASPDGRTAFVPIYGNSGVGKPGTDGEKIAVIDIASRKVVGNIDFKRVRAAMDDGPIIVQAAVPVLQGDDPTRLEARVLAAEHLAYPLAVRLIAESRLRIEGERVVVDGTALPGQMLLLSPAA